MYMCHTHKLTKSIYSSLFPHLQTEQQHEKGIVASTKSRGVQLPPLFLENMTDRPTDQTINKQTDGPGHGTLNTSQKYF